MRKTRSLEMRNRFSGIRNIGASMVVLIFTMAVSASAGETKPQLCQGNYQSEAQAKEQLAGFARNYSNLEQCQARAARIREGLLHGAGLWPLPERCDLKPIILAKHLGLSLDKVSKPDGSIDESFVTLEKMGDLYVFNDAHPRPANALKPGDPTAIPLETVRKWSAPYRGWHHHPNHVIPAKPGIKGFEDIKMTDVPTVFQVPGDKNWYMKEIL